MKRLNQRLVARSVSLPAAVLFFLMLIGAPAWAAGTEPSIKKTNPSLPATYPLELDVVSPSPTAAITVTPAPGFTNIPCPPSNAANCTTHYPAGTHVTATATSGVPVLGHNWQFAVYLNGPPVGMNGPGPTIVSGCIWTTNTCSFVMPPHALEVHVEIVGAPPPPKCDLSIGKSPARGTKTPLHTGQQVTYEIVVTNQGTGSCQAPLSVTDPVPAGLTYLSGGPPPWTCPGGPIVGPNPLTCTYGLALAPNQSTLLLLTFKVTGPPPALIQNCTEIHNPNDSNPANNRACNQLPVVGTD